jgi:branched-chain amino acid transport system substrate-binding protein
MKKLLALLVVALCVVSMAFAGGTKDSDTVTIGAIFPLSGSLAYYGTETRDGVQFAIDEINAAGGLLGKKIAVIFEDDEGNSEKTVNAFTKLTSRDKVNYIIGSVTSGATQAICPLAQRNRILLISPSATNIDITKAGDYIFRACFIDPFQGVVGADFAFQTLGLRRASVLYDAGADYNTGLAEAFKDRFKALGGQLVADEAYQSGDVDFNAQVTRIKAANPDMVYLPNYYNDVTLQVKQLRDQAVNCTLVGGEGWDGLIDLSGDEILGSYWSAAFASDTTDPKGVAFINAYRAKTGKTASMFVALGYDSMMLVADAIKAAGTFDTSVVKNSLAKVSGTYVTGNIRFDADRNPIKGAVILEITKRDGKLTNVYKTTVNP